MSDELSELLVASEAEPTVSFLVRQPPREFPFAVFKPSGEKISLGRIFIDEASDKVLFEFNSDVELRFNGSMRSHVAGARLETTGGNAYVLTGGSHHTNSSDLLSVVANLGAGLAGDEWSSDLMSARAEKYRAEGERYRKRAFYMAAARRNAMPRRPKKKRGCGCE